MDNQLPHSLIPTKSLMYWRKSLINGMACVPVILGIDEEKNFFLKSKDAIEFSIPATEVDVKFTSWGTMVVKASGKKYDIVPMGAAVSPDPTPEQLEEIKAASGANASKDRLATELGAAGTAIGGAAGVAGSAAMQYAYYQGLGSMKEWQEALSQAGATVKRSSMRAMMYFTVGMVALLVIFFIIGSMHKQ